MSQSTTLTKYLDVLWCLREAEKELALSLKKDVGPALPKLDTVYFHDVGACLDLHWQSTQHVRGQVETFKAQKTNLAKQILKDFDLPLESSHLTSGEVALSHSKISYSSFTEVIESISLELSDFYAGPDALKLFVHDRLGPNEPPLHFNSWEQRFQQRMAQAKDKIGKIKQNIVNITNSASITFKNTQLVQDINKWSAFVGIIDESFTHLLKNAIEEAIQSYIYQFQGKNHRELFGVNIKLSPSCELIQVPTQQDLVGKLSQLFHSTLFTVCPDNAVAHVISTPTTATKDGTISPKKMCTENAQLKSSLSTLSGMLQAVGEELTLTAAKIRKEWEIYWGPSMATASCSGLLQAITNIQSQFVVSHSILRGAIQLNAFPLQDSLISILHVQIENAKDNEIKALVTTWTAALQADKSPNGTLNNSSTAPLSTIGTPSIPTKRSTSDNANFDPLLFAKAAIENLSITPRTPPSKSIDSAKANTYPEIKLSVESSLTPSTTQQVVPFVSMITSENKQRTTPVEEVSETKQPEHSEIAAIPPQSTTPKILPDSAADFRRKVELANSASAAAAKRKEELRLSPRSPSQRLASLQGVSSPTCEPQPQVPPFTNRDPRPTLVPLQPPAVETSVLVAKSIIKGSTNEYQPPATAPTNAARPSRAVDFDPNTTLGGGPTSAAFKKATAPPEDDDETILRKLMQKEKESMDRIRQMKEKDEQRRKDLAALHRREVAGDESQSYSARSLPPINSTEAPVSSYSSKLVEDLRQSQEREKRVLDAVNKENEKLRQLRESRDSEHITRPDSALRRKLSLPSGQVNSSPVQHQPTPPAGPQQPPALHTIRKPQTAPLPIGTPRGTSNGAPSPLDLSNSSLLDIYKSYCSQFGIKPNSGMLKMLPTTLGENITKINLDLNYIGVKGFQPLLQILKVNRGLTFLNLKDNNLENNEIRALVNVLCTDSGDLLRHLDISNNPVSMAGGTALLDLIDKQKALNTVIVSGTLIQPKIVEKISEALAKK